MKTNIRLIILFAIVFWSTNTYSQTEEIFYYPKLPQVELAVAKTNLERALKSSYFPNNEKNYWSQPENVTVLDNRFILTFKQPQMPVILYFTDLNKYKIEVIRIHGLDKKWGFEVRLGELAISVTKDDIYGWELPDYLYFFQKQNIENPDSSQLVLFEPIAAQYRALIVKPPVSEEQRKFIVQANLFNQQKMYIKAIELYKKALELDQTAYPAAYSNLALLSAQINDFQAAIFYMKKYLLLEPEALDARGAQDKIYEWEAQ
jgi:tetratricopeptide (TPR) repeat protein